MEFKKASSIHPNFLQPVLIEEKLDGVEFTCIPITIPDHPAVSGEALAKTEAKSEVWERAVASRRTGKLALYGSY